MRRSCGVLLPVFSLPGRYGIGSLGLEARRFVDFLSRAGQSFWQILPLGPTGYGDSPYQPLSSFAGSPYIIDLDTLVEQGLMKQQELPPDYDVNASRVNYEKLYHTRFKLLRSIYVKNRLRLAGDMQAFTDENADWLNDYALFMAIRNDMRCASLQNWPCELKVRKPEALAFARDSLRDEVEFHIFLQMLFFRQWEALKAYANDKGVGIIGDMPIYCAEDSADVWAAPEQFQLDAERKPLAVGGVPPDDFCAEGQLWGNPLYDWEAQERDGYSWWLGRIAHHLKMFDMVRIDHFRGFESYWSIPAGAASANAPGAQWKQGPGMKLFSRVLRRFGGGRIIAEDLGGMTDEVLAFLHETGLPGMRVLQFGFDPKCDSAYLPHNYPRNCVAYTGTHDNAPILGWYAETNSQARSFARRYCRLDRREGFHWGFIRAVWASTADLAVVPAQDALGLGMEARTNTPATLGGNWQWRMAGGALNDEIVEKLLDLTRLYRRTTNVCRLVGKNVEEGDYA